MSGYSRLDLTKACHDPVPKPWEAAVAREQRKLAAILAADVAGYSRLMVRDESGALARFCSATEQ